METKIIYSDWGFASRVGDNIYLNKGLKSWKRLHKAVLNHENEHTSHFSYKDIMIDANGEWVKGYRMLYWAFIFSHPKSWVHFLPVWKYDDVLAIDPIMSFMWFLFMLVVIISFVAIKIIT